MLNGECNENVCRQINCFKIISYVYKLYIHTALSYFMKSFMK